MENNPFRCPKCSSTEYTQDEIRTSGGLSRFFDVQNKKFIAVSCQKCGFTEFYKKMSSTLGNVVDFFFGG